MHGPHQHVARHGHDPLSTVGTGGGQLLFLLHMLAPDIAKCRTSSPHHHQTPVCLLVPPYTSFSSSLLQVEPTGVASARGGSSSMPPHTDNKIFVVVEHDSGGGAASHARGMCCLAAPPLLSSLWVAGQHGLTIFAVLLRSARHVNRPTRARSGTAHEARWPVMA